MMHSSGKGKTKVLVNKWLKKGTLHAKQLVLSIPPQLWLSKLFSSVQYASCHSRAPRRTGNRTRVSD